MVFDGKAAAGAVREELVKCGKLLGKSLLIFQADGGEEESTYVRLKRKMGESLGVAVGVEYFKSKEELRKRLGEKIAADGVLVQLPVVGADGQEIQELLDLIPPEKDVDGLTTFSRFVPAAVKAVDRVLVHAWVKANLRFSTAGVVGAAGMMGRRLVKWLEERALEVENFDRGDDLSGLFNYDIVIGVTGSCGLIRGEMVKEGVVAIDLGYPEGDFVFEEVRQKANLVTPVPGGVGPLTVVCLFENLAQT